MNVKLTTTSGEKEVLVNWDNVNFAKSIMSHYGDEYTEVNCGGKDLSVKETVEEIEDEIKRLNS